jgi:chloramphenicol 3-O-phosphotransferase
MEQCWMHFGLDAFRAGCISGWMHFGIDAF